MCKDIKDENSKILLRNEHMKILLVNVPMNLETPTKSMEPLGIAYIAAVLLEDGHDVVLKDFDVEMYLPSAFIHLCESFRPDVIGFSCTTAGFVNVEKIIDHFKKCYSKSKETVIILGGPHSSSLPERTLRECNAYIVVRGEGERTVSELVGVLENRGDIGDVKGITYRGDDGIIHQTPDRELIEDLDSIPFPARHLLPMGSYRSTEVIFGHRVGSIISSRGCPYSCVYCYNSKSSNKQVRFRSPENVCDEIRVMVDEFGVDVVRFVDDLLTISKKRLFHLCDLLEAEFCGGESTISWMCQSRVDTITPEFVDRMKRAGCFMLTFGIETGDEGILNFINKRTTLAQAKNAVRVAQAAGFKVRGDFMIGFPYDTHSSIRRTVEFAKDLNADVSAFFITTPFPHSLLWDMAISSGIIDERSVSWDLFTANTPYFTNKSISKRDLEYYMDFIPMYIYRGKIWDEISSLENWRRFFSHGLNKSSFGIVFPKAGLVISRFLGKDGTLPKFRYINTMLRALVTKRLEK